MENALPEKAEKDQLTVLEGEIARQGSAGCNSSCYCQLLRESRQKNPEKVWYGDLTPSFYIDGDCPSHSPVRSGLRSGKMKGKRT